MKTQIDYSASYYPNHLRPFEYEFEPGKVLACFLEYEPPDRGVGYPGGAWLVYAFAGGVDIEGVLADSVILAIEEAASWQFSQNC
jgi:hypothetical protein